MYEPVASVLCLAPVNLPRKPTRPVSYYAFFKGWLLLSQPPGCLGLFTSFSTEHSTEATDHTFSMVVEERSVSLRRSIEKLAGDIRSANGDMSNGNGGEKPPRRKPKVSCATLIGAGLVGP